MSDNTLLGRVMDRIAYHERQAADLRRLLDDGGPGSGRDEPPLADLDAVKVRPLQLRQVPGFRKSTVRVPRIASARRRAGFISETVAKALAGSPNATTRELVDIIFRRYGAHISHTQVGNALREGEDAGDVVRNNDSGPRRTRWRLTNTPAAAEVKNRLAHGALDDAIGAVLADGKARRPVEIRSILHGQLGIKADSTSISNVLRRGADRGRIVRHDAENRFDVRWSLAPASPTNGHAKPLDGGLVRAPAMQAAV